MKRRLLLPGLSLAVVGALLGVGTAALLDDSETSATQVLTDGTLNLELGGTAQSLPIDLSDLEPGDADAAAAVLSLSNTGSLPGTLSLRVLETSDTENTCTEPEGVAEPACADDTDGELDERLLVTLTSGSDTWTGTLDSIHNVLRNLTGTLAAGGSRNLTIGWNLPGPTTGNDVQSDGAVFVIEARLDQYVPPASGPDAFIDISATGTDIGNHCDDCSTTVAMPFSATLYGTPSSTLTVSSNGFASLNGGGGGFTNGTLPNAGLGVALVPHWDDMRTDASGARILRHTLGVAPNRTFIVQWDDVTYFSAGGRATFQAQIREGSSHVVLAYESVANSGVSATVGVNRNGTTAILHSFNAAVLPPPGNVISYDIP